MTHPPSLLSPPFARPAPSDVPLHDLISHRWSPRAFAPIGITVGELQSLFEAARWAPSAFNEQPWHFLCARRENIDQFKKLLDCLNPNNQLWAQHAAVLIIAVARLELTGKGQPNRTAFYDLGQAVASLTSQATSLGIAVHQMVGFDAAQARSACTIPEGHEPLVALAAGRPGTPDSLPDNLRQRELAARTRKPATDFVYAAQWGATGAW